MPRCKGRSHKRLNQLITDGTDDPLGLCKPAWRLPVGNVGDRLLRDGERQTIYDEYDAEKSEEWRTPTGAGAPEHNFGVQRFIVGR